MAQEGQCGNEHMDGKHRSDDKYRQLSHVLPEAGGGIDAVFGGSRLFRSLQNITPSEPLYLAADR